MWSKHYERSKMLSFKQFRENLQESVDKKPLHYMIGTRRAGGYGVVQKVGPDHNPQYWDHSLAHGTHKTVAAAKKWAKAHAGSRPHKIEVKD